jgi:rfaE bifunctional protein kinase chain/domain
MPSTPPSDATLPLEDLLARAAGARVAVVGDFCLDAYWELDGGEPELSIETGLPTRRVRAQRYSPGGAGNVAVNLAALGVAKVSAIGLAGDDPFGPRLAAELRAAGVDCTRLFRGPPGWQTCVYAKPLRNGAEENRVDFGAFNEPDDGALAQLCAAIEEAASTHDALVVNRQLPAGLVGKRIAGAINRVAAAHPGFFVLVDARDGAGLFRGAALKLNESEAVRMAIAGEAGDEAKAAAEAGDALRLAAAIHRATGRAVFVTRGAKGLVAAAGGRTADVPGVRVPPPIDPVGAGDCIVSALAATLAKGGADDAGQAFQAARFANLAASVILRKLHTTGSASPAEILAAAEAAEYVFEPTLAEDPRLAVRLPGTEIEIVRELPAGTAIRHAVFDHDGTLSTLREGWEKIMEPMMVDAVLGGQAARADDALRARVAQACHELIDHTTGVQTLVQMQALVELVRRFGIVPEADVLDAAGYKRVYNDALIAQVRGRVRKLDRGELDPADFHLKNARALLEALHAKGVRLYLASGTDQDDVRAEARALGYADLFEDRIYGATGDLRAEAKRQVLDRIFASSGLSGSSVAVFGDGPVEIREARRHGAIAVGVASDEVRRFGLNPAKRRRLIRAGADLVVPDYSQFPRLLSALRL